jgi:hypothetical protein
MGGDGVVVLGLGRQSVSAALDVYGVGKGG